MLYRVATISGNRRFVEPLQMNLAYPLSALASRWWFGSPRFSVPYTNTRRSALWAILARSLSDVFHMHDGYSTPTPKMRQYGSMLICSPARFVKKMAMAAVFLNDMARKRSRGHQTSDCALPPIAKPPSANFWSRSTSGKASSYDAPVE
uniref:Uncharacterized protein n=1 Tax=Anopheles melas TaxID=34690 RepID=A0A182TUY0_9DIPT